MIKYEELRADIDHYLMERFKYRKSLVCLTVDSIISTRRNSRVNLYLLIRRVSRMRAIRCSEPTVIPIIFFYIKINSFTENRLASYQYFPIILNCNFVRLSNIILFNCYCNKAYKSFCVMSYFKKKDFLIKFQRFSLRENNHQHLVLLFLFP